MLFYLLLLSLLLLLLLFALHLSFHDLEALKLKKSQRQRKNRSPDPAILGRVRTRDPDPGHFGPDFDSRSGHGSALTDPQSGACLRIMDEGDFRTDFGLLTDSFNLNLYLEKVCSLVGFEGGTACCCEIWIE